MIKKDSTAVIPSSPYYMTVSLRRPSNYSSGQEARVVSILFPASVFHDKTKNNSCCKKYQQIWCLSTVNPSGTEAPKDTLKKFHLFQSVLCKRSQCTKRALCPCATADTEHFCGPSPLTSISGSSFHAEEQLIYTLSSVRGAVVRWMGLSCAKKAILL